MRINNMLKQKNLLRIILLYAPGKSNATVLTHRLTKSNSNYISLQIFDEKKRTNHPSC